MFTSIIINVLLATSAFAAPRAKLGSTLAERVAARTARRGNTMIPSTSRVPASTDASHAEFSTVWAGAVFKSPPAGQKFTSVTGRFNAPIPSRPAGSTSGAFSAAAWVGIDGYTFQSAILQSGIDFTISGNGAISYHAWFEWFPSPATDFIGISISPGDTIQVLIFANSTISGIVALENLSTGTFVNATVFAPSLSAALGGQNAEWIVEDFKSNGSSVNFANFSPVTFTETLAFTDNSTTGVDLLDATIVELENSSGQSLTSVFILDSSSVQIIRTVNLICLK